GQRRLADVRREEELAAAVALGAEPGSVSDRDAEVRLVEAELGYPGRGGLRQLPCRPLAHSPERRGGFPRLAGGRLYLPVQARERPVDVALRGHAAAHRLARRGDRRDAGPVAAPCLEPRVHALLDGAEAVGVGLEPAPERG